MATIYGVEVADIITASPDKTDSAKSKRRTTVSIHSKAVYIYRLHGGFLLRNSMTSRMGDHKFVNDQR